MAWHGSGELEDCKAECKELRQFAAEKAGKHSKKHSKMMAIMWWTNENFLGYGHPLTGYTNTIGEREAANKIRDNIRKVAFCVLSWWKLRDFLKLVRQMSTSCTQFWRASCYLSQPSRLMRAWPNPCLSSGCRGSMNSSHQLEKRRRPAVVWDVKGLPWQTSGVHALI